MDEDGVGVNLRVVVLDTLVPVVASSIGKELSVRGEGSRSDGRRMAGEFTELGAVGLVPESDESVGSSRDEDISLVGREAVDRVNNSRLAGGGSGIAMVFVGEGLGSDLNASRGRRVQVSVVDLDASFGGSEREALGQCKSRYTARGVLERRLEARHGLQAFAQIEKHDLTIRRADHSELLVEGTSVYGG